MMFASGREAVLFYVKERMLGFVALGSEYIIESEGFEIQYDSNKIANSASYTVTVETLVDLEKIFKDSLNVMEIQALIAWAINAGPDDPDLNLKSGLTEFQELTKGGKWRRINRMLVKVENGLRRFKYLDLGAKDETRYKKVKCVI